MHRTAETVKADPKGGDVTKTKDGTVYRVIGNHGGAVHYWEGNRLAPETVSIEEWRRYSAEDEVLNVAQ